MAEIKILGIAGSLRKGSFNKTLLQTAVEVSPESVPISVFQELGAIPPFNQDDEQNPPDSVRKLKQEVRVADAILIATPEYNYSIPSVLKNAIDWASRPYGDSAWDGKPVALMSASIGMVGGARAQYQLRQSFVFLNMFALNKPEVLVPFAGEKIDGQGKLRDAYTKEKITELVAALINWTIELQQGGIAKK